MQWKTSDKNKNKTSLTEEEQQELFALAQKAAPTAETAAAEETKAATNALSALSPPLNLSDRRKTRTSPRTRSAAIVAMVGDERKSSNK